MDSNKTKQKAKKRFRTISISTKMEILKKFDEGMKVMQISKAMNMAEATVRSIKKQEQKIKNCAKYVSPNIAEAISRPRHPMVHKIENILYVWIKEQIENETELTSTMMRSKALSIFEDLKKENDSYGGTCPKFTASRGWFENYRKRFFLILNREGSSAELNNDEPAFKNELFEKHDFSNKSYTSGSSIDSTMECTGSLNNIIKEEFIQEDDNDCDNDPLKVQELTFNNTLSCNESLSSNSNHENYKELHKFLQLAESLKEQVSVVEKDEKRRKAFRMSLDGIMSYYKDLCEEYIHNDK